MSTPTPNSNPNSSPSADATVREAKPSEFAAIAQLARRAFVRDPVFSYFGSVEKLIPDDVDTPDGDNLHRFVSFLLNLCRLSGGRITVVVINEPSETGEGTHEKIVSGGLWLPPKKRIALWQVPRLVRGGIIGMLMKWGLTGLMRVGFEYLDASHAAMTAGYKLKGLKTLPEESWYLQLVMTDPDYQGQGLMALLMREAFAHAAPGTPFTLEATTAHSRDRYEHIGYELFKPLVLGAGKVNELGIPPASKEQAVGVDCYPMVYWNKKN